MLRHLVSVTTNLNLICSTKLCFTHISKCEQLLKCSTASTMLTFKSEFTPDEEEKVLSTLNECNNEDLLRYKVSQGRIKKIQIYKRKVGAFKSLNQVLEIDGFSEKILDEMCKRIIHKDEEQVNKEFEIKRKKPKQLIMPAFHLQPELNSVTGIYTNTMGISWARICRNDNKLSHWNSYYFDQLPKKMTIVDTFHSAISLVRKIPPSDIYVFESISALSPSGHDKPLMVTSHNQQLELISMLFSLLNTSLSHNVSLQQLDTEDHLVERIENKVYFIKSKLPARLFNLLVGFERVSAIKVVSELLENETMMNVKLPFTSVEVDCDLKTAFKEHSASDQEQLGQALLVLITFMELFVYNNESSWSKVSARNKKK